jgi:hypothetical protein
MQSPEECANPRGAVLSSVGASPSIALVHFSIAVRANHGISIRQEQQVKDHYSRSVQIWHADVAKNCPNLGKHC